MKKLCLLLACVVFVGVNFLQAQTVQITGTISSSEDGQPIPGVSIQVKGTTIGVVTDLQGNYTINVPQTATTLVVSFLGFRTQEIEIQGRQVINLQLEFDVLDLEEIVVVGYGVQRKREITGSIAQVKGDEIANLATPSFESQLAGRAAGVQVTTTSGVIGVAPRIRIRGISSISSGTYPLIVVDGVPIFTGDLGGYADNNALGDINPADIESIEILKDGSATAIYGSRAANGVMLITTKKGQKGRFKMTYNNYLGVAQPVRLFDLLNAEESILINNEKRTNAGQSIIAFADGTAGPAVDTDWQRAVLRGNAFQQDHNLSLSGATEQTNYYFSLGYSTMEGVSRPNEMSRFTFRSNVDQKVTKWLSIGANLGITQSQYFGMNTGENSLSGNIFSAIRQLPNTPIYNENHPTGYNIDFTSSGLVGRWNNATTIGDNLPNIVYVLDHNRFTTKVFRTIGNAFANVTLLPSLIFRTQLSVDATGSEGLLYYNPKHGDGQGSNGRVQNNFQNLTRWNYQNVLSYNETFADNHNLGVTLVSEFQKQKVNSFYAYGTDLSNEFFQYNLISGSFGTQYSGGGLTENGFLSYAGRLNYNFANKYFVQASFRYDGISSMPLANKYGVFPGFSLGWTLSEEAFMEDLTFINDLKLRASYAEVGNTSVGNYPYAGLYGAAKYADNNGIGFVQMGNDQLQWETSKKYGGGVDMMFMEGKYKFSYDYFVNDQDNLILAVPTPPSFGIFGNSYSANIGQLKNWGHEFFAEANIIRNKDLSVTVSGNISFVKNEIVSLVGEQTEMFPDNYTIIRVGESYRSIYGYDYHGVNNANGNPIYRKADGTLVQGNIPTSSYVVYDPANPSDISQASSLSSVDDKILFGPSLPTYFGALTGNVRFKGFDFAMMFRFSGGNYIMNRTRDDLTQHSFTNNGREILGRWQSESEPGDGWTPRLWAQGGNFINIQNQTNGRFVEKGDFFKLQNLVIGYTLPADMLAKFGITGLRIFAQGQELLMFTGYTGIDPEMESGGVDFNLTPRMRTLTFGINLTL
ncbi:MAG: TonB-dependent receptor [Tenuifilaceae bacterium]|jgi:TonB-linked SusC/RagA family outer membrane protein|nr:TonB-dependent receptor [Tenuifilaceae bacterium]